MAKRRHEAAMELSIPRPYGGEIVLRAGEQAPGLDTFFEQARDWFHRPEDTMLPLFEDEDSLSGEALRSNELEEFVKVAQGWGVPANLTIDYVPARPTNTPAVRGDAYILPATLGRRAIAFAITGAQEAGEKWGEDPSKLVVFMRDAGVSAEVTLRPLSAIKRTLSDRDREELSEALRRWKELDQDVLDILVTNVLSGTDRRGRTYISYDTVLDARERAKKTKLEDGKRYASGHRAEDRDEIHKSVLRLHNMGADVAPSEVERKRRRGRSAPVILMHELEYDLETGAPTGVWYALGAWAETADDEVTVSRRILSYDPYRQALEKRLGRLLSIMLVQHDPAVNKVVDLIGELHLSTEGANKGRMVARFDKALDALQEDGVIGHYTYAPDLQAHPLPARGLLEDWLERSLVVHRSRRTVLTR